jgi:hypothetical protein
MGNWNSPECCAPYYPFVDESHDRLINAPKTDGITITQHPGDQSITHTILPRQLMPRYERREREEGSQIPDWRSEDNSHHKTTDVSVDQTVITIIIVIDEKP